MSVIDAFQKHSDLYFIRFCRQNNGRQVIRLTYVKRTASMVGACCCFQVNYQEFVVGWLPEEPSMNALLCAAR
jgi:hypothetical protein